MVHMLVLAAAQLAATGQAVQLQAAQLGALTQHHLAAFLQAFLQVLQQQLHQIKRRSS
jgi:hypothetical protein